MRKEAIAEAIKSQSAGAGAGGQATPPPINSILQTFQAPSPSPQIQSPSPICIHSAPKTPKSPFVSRVMTPIASPMKKAIACLEELGQLTKLDLQDSWLPITESRNGNAYYAAFHTLSSGLGVQALVLPFAFTALGW